MPQCEEYPDKCNGSVRHSPKDNKWFCEKHYYTLGHLRAIGEK